MVGKIEAFSGGKMTREEVTTAAAAGAGSLPGGLLPIL